MLCCKPYLKSKFGVSDAAFKLLTLQCLCHNKVFLDNLVPTWMQLGLSNKSSTRMARLHQGYSRVLKPFCKSQSSLETQSAQQSSDHNDDFYEGSNDFVQIFPNEARSLLGGGKTFPAFSMHVHSSPKVMAVFLFLIFENFPIGGMFSILETM